MADPDAVLAARVPYDDDRDLFELAAHRVNTPIACIRGFAATLLQRGDDLDADTRRQFLEVVLEQSDRLQVLGRDMLTLARLREGVVAAARPLLPRDTLETIMEARGAEGLRVQLEGDLESKVVGDAGLLATALRALVDNAFAYGPRDRQVTLRVHVDPTESRWEVVDEGTWLAGEDIELLFRPFQRSESPLERRSSGAGLGLTVARSAAGAVGGTAGGEVRGDTTVFWLAVPGPVADGRTP